MMADEKGEGKELELDGKGKSKKMKDLDWKILTNK